MDQETLGMLAVLALIMVAACLVATSRLPKRVKLLLYIALLLRPVGSWLRHSVLYDFYRGTGDAPKYFRGGRDYAAQFTRGDFSPFFDSTTWVNDKWWGTQFVYFPSGIIQSLIGPSMLGTFMAFSLLAFLGLVGFAVAFRRSFPQIPLHRYVLWIWLFPSLWYWPSSIGKEAIVLMGIGLSIWGFAGGVRNRINWPLVAVGIFFIFAIRPQVAAVVIVSLILGHWFSLGSRWTVRKVVQGVLLLALGMWAIWMSMRFIGVGGFDLEGVQDYMEDKAGSGSGGGSAIEEVEIGPAGVPIALVNILFRPFPWEAHNLMAMVSALEIWVFWALVWFRRKSFFQGLRNWRSSRFVSTAVVFILLYSITLGMVISNLGIIARQRVFLFPFFFLLLVAAPGMVRKPVPLAPRAPLPRFAGQGIR